MRGGRVRYFVGGDGPPVVLVHGLGGAASNWRLARAAASRRGTACSCPTCPGTAARAPLPAAPNLDAFAEPVMRAVVEPRGCCRRSSSATRSAGLVALRLAMRRPDARRGARPRRRRPGSRSATRSGASSGSPSSVAPARPPDRAARGAARARRPRLRASAFGVLGRVRSAARSPRSRSSGFLAGRRAAHRHRGARGGARARRSRASTSTRVRCPALVLWGARDRQVPIDDAFEYARRLRAPLRTIADCGHLLIGERPDAVRRRDPGRS